MTPPLQIRLATVRDIQRILPLWEALAALHGELDPALAVAPGAPREYVEFLRDAVARFDTCVMLAIEGDAAVGFALGRIQVLPLPFREQRRGWIQDVYTVPARRREGIARRMVEALLAWFAGRQVVLIELTVAVRNAEALQFWEGLGFSTYMVRMKRMTGNAEQPTTGLRE